MKKTSFNVTGMTCSACSSRVDKAVSSLDGVSSCSVSLLTNSMTVEGDFGENEIISAVKKVGYGASVKGKTAVSSDENAKDESKRIFARLIISAVLTLVIMYLSMGHMIGLKFPNAFEKHSEANALTQLLLSAAALVCNQKFFISGFKGVTHGAPNMDTLVSLGSLASFSYSVFVLYGMIIYNTSSHLYFETAAMIPTLITVGKLLESRAKGRTADALNSLISLKPQTATVVRGDKEEKIDISDLRVGDIFAVRAGQSFPADGRVVFGQSTADESMLTGESIPVDKNIGSTVYTATLNQSGYLRCEATKVGEDTVLSQIIKTVSDASASKAPIARLADKVAGVFVPAVMGIALITFVIWMLISGNVGSSLSYAISVLVISCPCSLGLATPVAIMVGSGVGAKNGILFKNAASLENSGRINTVVLDKTGTLTEGKPHVVGIYCRDISENELLTVAATAESKSEHPLSRAVISEAEVRGISYPEPLSFSALVGNGVKAEVKDGVIYGGKTDFIKTLCEISDKDEKTVNEYAKKGSTPLLFCLNNNFIGAVFVSDRIKPDSKEAISELKRSGMSVCMLTGDNAVTANAIGKEAGIEKIISGVSPTAKAEALRELKTEGKCAMIGDGINDAPALTEADIGIAIGAGSDIAIDSADIVLMNSSLFDAVKAFRLSKATLKNIKENLFWAFFYNVIGIPVAAGALSPLGITMSPMLGSLCMSLSSVFVVTNALRLNFVKLGRAKIKVYDIPKEEESKKEEKTMVKTVKVKGMMCPHCEAHVKKALESILGIEEAIPSFKEDKVEIKCSENVSESDIAAAITEAGYTVE